MEVCASLWLEKPTHVHTMLLLCSWQTQESGEKDDWCMHMVQSPLCYPSRVQEERGRTRRPGVLRRTDSSCGQRADGHCTRLAGSTRGAGQAELDSRFC